MPVMVRNEKAGPTVFSDPENGVDIVWEGKGSPTGGDVRAVPDALLQNVAFINNLNLGVFSIEEDEGAAWDKIRIQTEAVQAQQKAKRDESLAAIDRTSNRVVARADIDESGTVVNKPVDDLIEIPLD